MNYEISAETGISDYFYTQRKINYLCHSHVHSHIEFIYVLEGHLVLKTDEETCLLEQNQMAVVMPYQIHSLTPKDYSDTFIIACPPEYISEYRQTFQDKIFSPSQVPISQVIHNIIMDITVSDVQDFFKNKALIYYTIAEFFKKSSLTHRKSQEYDVYRKAIVYISEHYTEKITQESVAFHIGVTAPHLSRVLNSRGKSKFFDLVNSLRIYKAKKMLEQTNLPICDIAFEVGYGSIRNFNRVFQEYFGCRPSDIRNSLTTSSSKT